jgi:NAD(P)-dependent dehydrogenase (short-subunit alcohol dehydrogenase family)
MFEESFPADLKKAITVCCCPLLTDLHGLTPKFPKASNTLNRTAKPVEIAQVMLFLAGDQSSFMNGSTVAAHAGQTPT